MEIVVFVYGQLDSLDLDFRVGRPGPLGLVPWARVAHGLCLIQSSDVGLCGPPAVVFISWVHIVGTRCCIWRRAAPAVPVEPSESNEQTDEDLSPLSASSHLQGEFFRFREINLGNNYHGGAGAWKRGGGLIQEALAPEESGKVNIY